MNVYVIINYLKIKSSLFYLPISLLTVIVLFLHHNDSLHIDSYVQIQKDSFFIINDYLSQFPSVIYNINQYCLQ